MSKRISSKSRQCAEAIGNREAFSTHGALYALDGGMHTGSAGRLSGDDLARYLSDLPGMTYAVFSYATPIAWVSNGKAYRVGQKFSVTTSHHMGKCYLLSDDK